MRRAAVALTVGFVTGWFASPDSVIVEQQTIVEHVPLPNMNYDLSWTQETPIADSLVDFDEVDRQTDCLWELMQDAGVEITLEVVMAFGTWADAQGGPCAMVERGE